MAALWYGIMVGLLIMVEVHLCNDGGWWRCNPGYIDGTSSDPAAIFEIMRPLNLESGCRWF